jgi:hypothetical protein
MQRVFITNRAKAVKGNRPYWCAERDAWYFMSAIVPVNLQNPDGLAEVFGIPVPWESSRVVNRFERAQEGGAEIGRSSEASGDNLVPHNTG